jgi:hypothetical protein
MNKPMNNAINKENQPFFNIPKNKEGNPDFLWLAFQTVLSSSPDAWDGETIFKHIEREDFDMECSKQVSLWQPFVGFPKDEFLEAVLVLEDLHINTYIEGQNSVAVDNPSPKSRKGKSKPTK